MTIPIMKVITNHDGHVVITSRKENDARWMWYTINSSSMSIQDMQETILKIQQGVHEQHLVSHNGRCRNYKINDTFISLSPGGEKGGKTKPRYIMISETPDMYKTHILPKIECPEWVKRIDNKVADGEVIYRETNDYYLMPGFYWNRNIKDLHLMVLFKDKNLASIRDLNGCHIDMLNRTRDEVIEYIKDNYNCPPEMLRCFFHYHPTAWRLHMHVQLVSAKTSISSSTQCARARTLGEVINNIKVCSNYYQVSTLDCIISRERCKEFGYLKVPQVTV